MASKLVYVYLVTYVEEEWTKYRQEIEDVQLTVTNFTVCKFILVGSPLHVIKLLYIILIKTDRPCGSRAKNRVTALPDCRLWCQGQLQSHVVKDNKKRLSGKNPLVCEDPSGTGVNPHEHQTAGITEILLKTRLAD